ncbi:MAG: hypothetical protein OCC45_09870 [Desulfotalea sp.]
MKFIKSLLAFLFLLLLFVAIAVGSYWIANYKNWPWWAGACIFGGFVGFVVACLFFRRWFLRRREKAFVKRIIDQDESSLAALKPRHSGEEELQRRWMEAVYLLQNSGLRNHGNPLYVLPWYMVFGEENSGKSSAIAGARLTSILTDVGPVPGVSATKNCDWWFSEEAIIIDTAGRYSDQNSESNTQQEWEKFLTLLAKYRRKEPLNGLILTVPADRLLAGDSDWLREYGKTLRKRVNELMRVLGARFPVYVLVTKMDLVFGFKGLSEILPEEALSQAMGYVNIDSSTSRPDDIIELAVKSLDEKLRELRLLQLGDLTEFDSAFLLLSDEIKALKLFLVTFTEGIFEENPYQELPMFRGVYFSSAKQPGEQTSQIFNSLKSITVPAKRHLERSKGIFLHDFFVKILPSDRNVFTPIFEFLNWKRVTSHLGLTSWYLVLFFVCGLFSLSYINNRDVMNLVFEDYPTKPIFSDNIDEKIIQFTSLLSEIEEISGANSKWISPRVGLNVSKTAELEIKEFYCQNFRKLVLEPTNKKIESYVEKKLSLKEGKFKNSDTYTKYLVWKIDLLSDRLSATSQPNFSSFGKPTGASLGKAVAGFSPELVDDYIDLYTLYLTWSNDLLQLKEDKLLYTAKLRRMFRFEGDVYKWLLKGVNEDPKLESIALSSFWVDGYYKDSSVIEPAYTFAGYNELLNSLELVKQALADDADFKKYEDRFWTWYAEEYHKAWLGFASNFIQGENYLRGRDGYLEMGKKMQFVSNPYFSLITRMDKEFEAIRKLGKTFELVSLVEKFQSILSRYTKIQKGGALKASEKAILSVNSLVAKVDKNAVIGIEESVNFFNALKSYMGILGELAKVSSNRETTFIYMSKKFSGEVDKKPVSSKSTDSKSDSETVEQVLSVLKKNIHIKDSTEDHQVFWWLVYGPYEFLTYVSIEETSCALQSRWQENVLANTTHTPENKIRKTLFGKEGLVDKFLSDPAKPFLKNSVNGWASSEYMGMSISFTDDFTSVLNNGSRGIQQLQDKYQVKIDTVPTSTNSDATEEPFGTILTLQCSDGEQTLSNFNYAEGKLFTWNPSSCGTTSLRIKFSDFELLKIYEGKQGFAKFLNDIGDGLKLFKPDDFPEHKSSLTDLKVSSIGVAYRFADAKAVTDTLLLKPINVPEKISECWDLQEHELDIVNQKTQK